MSCPEQHIPHQPTRALACANEARLAAAGLRQRVASGEMTLAEAIDHPDAASLTITRLLEAQPHWGKVRAKACLADLTAEREPISPLRRVRDLSLRQRALVVRCANPLSGSEERQLSVLIALLDGPLTGVSVSEAAGLANVTGVLDGMARRSLVEVDGWRRTRPERWVRVWAITARGRAALPDLEARSAA